MTALLPPTYEKVLEVGCANGAFSAALKLASETWGVEQVQAAAAKAALRLTHVLNGKYDEVADRIPADYFDLAVCNDVIEHVEDHDRFLASIHEKLRPRACLIGSVPNVRNYRVLYELLVHRDWQYGDYGILDRTHLRFFTEKSLRRALERSGFDVEVLVGINSSIQRVDDALNMAKRAFFSCVSAATLGRYRDIRYLQFGFRARKGSQDPTARVRQQKR